MKRIQVLLVDDHALFRKGLAGLLKNEEAFEVVGEAGDGVEALEKARQLKPDIILMDISMPQMDGIEATRKIREVLPSTKVVILTILEEDERLFDAIKAGANGYVLKKVQPDYLLETLCAVARGEAAISGMMAAKILEEFAGQSRKSSKETHDVLSAREKEVLQLLTKGMTNKEISATLDITDNTVKNHLKNILAKLHVENRVQAAKFALEHGLFAKENQT